MIAPWMLSAILFTTLLGAAAMFAELALRNAGRQARWPWLVALAVGVVWPMLAPLIRRALSGSPALLDVAVAMPSVRVVPDALPGVPLARWVDVALLSLWLVASMVALGRLAHALVLVRRIRRASEPRIVDDVPVLVTEGIGPAVVGVVRPRVLIPTSLLELERPLRQLALRHEVEHGRAHDQLALVGSAVALALVPWNMPVWWIVRRYRLAIEIDCDARVLASEPNARQYGQLLLLISQRRRVATFAPMLAPSISHLERRIAAMLPVISRGRRTRVAVALAGAIVIAIAACSSRISDGIAGPKPQVAARAPSTDPEKPYLEYQINKPATQIFGTAKLKYPEALWSANVQGTVFAQFVVNVDGSVDVSTFKVLKSDHELFTQAVRDALPGIRFTPAEVKGTRVRQLVKEPFSFARDLATAFPPAIPRPVNALEPLGDFQVERQARQIPGTGNLRYPDELRLANVEGEVIAQFVVTEDGKYLEGSFKVVKSSNPLFDDAVRNAVPNMRFTPAIVGGKAVRQMIERPFTFSLSKQ